MAELFVKQASLYAKIRPNYPASLFEMIASLTHHHERAWDVGTGNGQAATMLAEHYKSVVATDVSEEQLALAEQHPKVTYTKMTATPSQDELERVVGAEGSVDAVTVAQAMHWFDLDKFYPTVKHVLRKPGGVVAAWCYGLPLVNPELDKIVARLYKASAPHWAPQVKFVEEEYRSIPFPFQPAREDGVGPFKMDIVKSWTLDDYMCLLNSFSGLQTARDRGVQLLDERLTSALSSAWGPERVCQVTFRLSLLVGTVGSAN